MVGTLVNLPGYCIHQELCNCSRNLNYREYRETDSFKVAIKFLRNFYHNFNKILAFWQHYIIAKNLKSSEMNQTYSVNANQTSYVWVMANLSLIALKKWVKPEIKQSLPNFLEIAINWQNIKDLESNFSPREDTEFIILFSM